jgi:hypothetical protein
MREKFVTYAMVEKGHGLDIIESCAGGKRGYVWDVADDTETFGLDNLQPEVVEGACRNHYGSFPVTWNSSMAKGYVQQPRK